MIDIGTADPLQLIFFKINNTYTGYFIKLNFLKFPQKLFSVSAPLERGIQYASNELSQPQDIFFAYFPSCKVCTTSARQQLKHLKATLTSFIYKCFFKCCTKIFGYRGWVKIQIKKQLKKYK